MTPFQYRSENDIISYYQKACIISLYQKDSIVFDKESVDCFALFCIHEFAHLCFCLYCAKKWSSGWHEFNCFCAHTPSISFPDGKVKMRIECLSFDRIFTREFQSKFTRTLIALHYTAVIKLTVGIRCGGYRPAQRGRVCRPIAKHCIGGQVETFETESNRGGVVAFWLIQREGLMKPLIAREARRQRGIYSLRLEPIWNFFFGVCKPCAVPRFIVDRHIHG